MGLFSKKKPAAAKSAAKKPAAKAKTKAAPKNDAAEVMARMKQKQAENPEDCPFC